MADFVKLARTAQRLITKNGRSMTLAKESITPRDPSKPWSGSDCGTTEITAVVAVTQYSEDEVDGDRIRRGDRQAWVAPPSSGERIEDFDYVIDGDRRWSIQDVLVIEPAETVVAYRMQLRR